MQRLEDSRSWIPKYSSSTNSRDYSISRNLFVISKGRSVEVILGIQGIERQKLSNFH
jgi:hypothetical protein